MPRLSITITCLKAAMFDQITLQIGDTAPELKLKDQHGKLVFLRDYAGRWVVLYSIQRRHAQLHSRGLRLSR